MVESCKQQFWEQDISKLLLAYSFQEIFFLGQNLKLVHVTYFSDKLSVLFWLPAVDIFFLKFNFSLHQRNTPRKYTYSKRSNKNIEKQNFSDCNGTQSYNHLIRKRTINHLAKPFSATNRFSSLCHMLMLMNPCVVYTGLKIPCQPFLIFLNFRSCSCSRFTIQQFTIQRCTIHE